MRNVIILTTATVLLTLTGCETLMNSVATLGTAVGQATGTISADQAESIKKTSSAVGKSMEQITPEQEYYVGRSIGAMILKTYKPYDNSSLNNYLNMIGQTLAAVSDKPETFAGYHFLALETDEINAFAAPGGFIFVSRGLIKCCKSEDALAAVLAHEIGHVQLAHGIGAIKKSRWTGAVTTALAEGAKSLGPQQLASLTQAFEGALSDITQTLVNEGYSRKFEYEADKAAVQILQRIGYNPIGLRDLLLELENHSQPGKGFSKTHPDPKDRVREIEKLIQNTGPVLQPTERKTRFQKTVAAL